MTIRDWIKVILLFGLVMAATILIWNVGKAHAVRPDGGILGYSFGASAIPLGLISYWLTKITYGTKRRWVLMLLVLSPVLSACAATAIAIQSGVIVQLTAINLPLCGISVGWQLAGGFVQPQGKAPASGLTSAAPATPPARG